MRQSSSGSWRSCGGAAMPLPSRSSRRASGQLPRRSRARPASWRRSVCPARRSGCGEAGSTSSDECSSARRPGCRHGLAVAARSRGRHDPCRSRDDPETRREKAVTQINEHPEVLLYSRIRKSPYFYASRRHGIQKYSFYNHMYHPRHYRDPVEEYWELLNGVTLWDVGVERQVEITGPDAFTFTNTLVPRDLNKCEVGQCKYVFVTSPEGGILNDPVLLRLDENHFWLSLADSDILLWAWGVAHNAGLDVTIREPDVGPVQIQGPRSKDVLVELLGESVLDIPYYFM